MKFLKKFAVIVVILLFALLAFFLFGDDSDGSSYGDETASTNIIKVLKDGFKDQDNLVTQEYYFTLVDSCSNEKISFEINDKKHEIPLTESHCVYSVDGYVNAYIKLEDIKFENKGNTIKVLIPKSQLETPNIDMSTRKIFDEKNNIFHPISPKDVLKSVEELQTQATENAVEKGVLERANKHAIELIDSMVNQLLKAANADPSIKVECVIV